MVFHSTVLFVKDIEVSKKFYTGFLNFFFEHDFGKNAILTNSLTLWDVPPEHIPSSTSVTKSGPKWFEQYFENRDIEEVFDKRNNEGITFLHSVREEPRGQRTRQFFDPGNHLIEIGEPMNVLVKNMQQSGTSPEMIANKTSIQLHTGNSLISK
jgi:catechol 2,3-dioxygenase-like lactoylglutathione lyase family enzyme